MADAAKLLISELSDDYDIVVKALGRMTKHSGDNGDDAIVDSAKSFVHSSSVLADKFKKPAGNACEAGRRTGARTSDHGRRPGRCRSWPTRLRGYARFEDKVGIPSHAMINRSQTDPALLVARFSRRNFTGRPCSRSRP